jgi:hypothetical protein
MLCENLRSHGGKLEPLKVVTICYHLRFFHLGEAKHKVGWEPIQIASNRLIQGFCRDAIGLRKISITIFSNTALFLLC